MDAPADRVDQIPMQQRVVDRLADIILHADDVLAMLRREPPTLQLRQVESCIRIVYGDMNRLMNALCD